MKLIHLAPLLLACACSKKEGEAQASASAPAAAPQSAGACPPAKIVVDGVEQKGLHGLAVTLKNGEYETEQVELYSSDTIGCPEVLAPSLTLPDGTVAVRAYYHPQAQGLGTEAFTEMGISGIKLVAKAKAVGGDTEICIPPGSTFTPNAGTLTGKKVEVSGNLAGRYCGVKDMNAR